MKFLINFLISHFYDFFFKDIDCFKPANGETVTIKTKQLIPVEISLNLLKKEKCKIFGLLAS